ncbi:hypothetical protein BJ944DRAFT_259256 [Cunninghamella echinulata]|nr:hypothetical protein BJ944DRAFT_259256 [Cunninghamella echinulata]
MVDNQDRITNTSSPKDNYSQDSSGDISSNWSFPYDKFEMDLLQDTPLPNVLSDIAISSSPSEDNIDHNKDDSLNDNININEIDLNKDSNNNSIYSENCSSKNELFENYSPATRTRINQSFSNEFDLQEHISVDKAISPDHEQTNRHIENVVEEILERKKNNSTDYTPQIQDCKRMLEDIQKRFDTGMQEYIKSQEYQHFLASKQFSSNNHTNETDEDKNNNSRSESPNKTDHEINSSSSSSSSKISSLLSLNQQQIEEDLKKEEEMLKLRQFTDKVDRLVWDTVSHMAKKNILQNNNSEHVCERHKLWCETVLQKQLEIRNKPIYERLDETISQLTHWANFIRLQQDSLQKR